MATDKRYLKGKRLRIKLRSVGGHVDEQNEDPERKKPHYQLLNVLHRWTNNCRAATNYDLFDLSFFPRSEHIDRKRQSWPDIPFELEACLVRSTTIRGVASSS